MANPHITTIEKNPFHAIDQKIKEELKNWRTIIKPYQKSDNLKAIIQILNTFIPFLAISYLMYLSLDISFALVLGLGLLNGFFLSRLFIIQHDCGHQSFFTSKTWNNRLGYICSFFTSIPYKYWARAHNFHHAHNGQLETREVGDIFFLTVEEYRKLSPLKRLGYRIFRFPAIIFILAPTAYILISNRYPFFNFKGWLKTRLSQLYNNLALIAVYTALGFLIGWKTFLIVQGLNLFFFGIVAFWFFYIQHQHEEAYKQWKKNWNHLLASIRGSTFYDIPKVFHWLTGNIGFHHIHHLNPSIPNYNLEKCAKENPVLQKYVTSLSFTDSLKCMFNKLWDEERQRMINFREFYRLEKKRMGMS